MNGRNFKEKGRSECSGLNYLTIYFLLNHYIDQFPLDHDNLAGFLAVHELLDGLGGQGGLLSFFLADPDGDGDLVARGARVARLSGRHARG